MYLIYLITNTKNGKVYVGQTGRSLRKRWQQHQSSARQNKTSYFGNALRKYGAESFTYPQVVASAATKECADLLETVGILAFSSNNPSHGYNLTLGGEGQAATAETKAKISALKKGSKNQKVSQANRKRKGEKRKPFTIEHLAHMSAAWSPERRKAYADKNRERRGAPVGPFSEKHRASLRACWTPERRAAQAQRLIKINQSPGQRKKDSERIIIFNTKRREKSHAQ